MRKIFLFIFIVAITCKTSAQKNDNAIALELITNNHALIGLSEEDLNDVIIKNSYFDRFMGVHLVYLQQSYIGLPVYNEIQVLAFKNGKLVSATGDRIRKIEKLAGNDVAPAYAAEAAVATAMAFKNISNYTQLNGKIAGSTIDFGKLNVCSETVTAELMWLPLKERSEIHLVWEIRVVPLTSADYFMIRVDANKNEVVDENNFTVSCNWNAKEDNHDEKEITSSIEKENTISEAESPKSPNIVANASYLIIPYPAESPIHSGGTAATVNNPWSLSPGNATSLGWHNDGINNYITTRGNNVYAQEDRDNNDASFGNMGVSSTSPDPLTFNSSPDFTQAPTITSNQRFSITNLFYWNNLAHDISYLHGFDEVSGNFQNNNSGRGGFGNDYVIADCQDAGGTSNANFSTPNDGSKPRMQMFLWSGSPQKDGSLDNGIVCHEFFHGVSNRLTGGPSNSGCLVNDENMGEGWSDYFALMMTQNWATSILTTGYTTPRSVGNYAAGQSITGRGIRTQKYCTNMSINSKVYLTIIPAESHDRGEIWCATLWDMTWNIINQTSHINPNLFDTTSNGGNSIALKLVLEGMKLQPCSPGFISARDAILKADIILYGGQFQCAIKEAFRKRGMGELASEGSSNSITDQVPNYNGGVKIELTQGGVTAVPEGQEIQYNIIVTSSCQAVSNYIIRDTLPSNVTYVSGGNYDTASRIVSFIVNQGIGVTQSYQFIVRINNGTYFTPSYPISENFNNNTSLPSGWISYANPSTSKWTISNIDSHSAPNALYCENLNISGDQKIETPSIPLTPGTNPRFSFWHKYNSEDGWDGGVVELSVNGGLNWVDLSNYFVENPYNTILGNAPSCVLSNRPAFSGNSVVFIKSIIDLGSFAGSLIKLRFWFASDDNSAGLPSPTGWFVDDVLVEIVPVVKMRATVFTQSNNKIAYSDTITQILAAQTCLSATINSQPINISACSGSNAIFNINDAGTNNKYQWQVSTNGGLSYNNITGDTASSITLNAVTLSENNNLYRIVIQNACPSTVTSNAALLKVSEPASISLQPLNQLLCAGLNASFNIAATGGINGYQWQVSANGGNTWSNLLGDTGTTLLFSGITSALNGNIYRVVVASCNRTISDSALLSVLTPPSINTQPQSVTVCNGQNHTFNVAATGSNINYEWQESIDGGNSYSNIFGATTASYSLNSVTSLLDSRLYRVIINGTCPSADTSSAALLSIGGVFNITAQPSDITACTGSDASISMGAVGVTGYQWQVSSNGGITWTDVAGARSSTLLFSPVTASLQGNKYRVALANCGPDTVSNFVTLTVKNPVSISTQPVNTGICIGNSGSMSISATGSSLSYQWQISVNNGLTFSDINGAISSQLNLTGVTSDMDGNIYQVILTPASPCNLQSSNAVILSVNSLPSVSYDANPTTDICAGVSLILSGTGASTYTWSPTISNGNTFVPSNSETYTVTGTDSNGCINTATVNINIKLLPQISITAVPANVSLLPGDQVVLTATSNPVSATFNWYKDNVLVSGVSGNTITVDYDHAGLYKATVSDPLTDCSNTSNIITIKDSIRTNVFVYPNPNQGSFIVRLPAGSITGNYLISIYDNKGALVYNNTVRFAYEEARLNLNNMSSGLYMIQVRTIDGEEIRTGKVVIGGHK